MSAKHTPGPWRVGNGAWVVSDVPSPGIRGSDDVEYYGGHLICESVSNQNANLIAAAPDLLEALESYVEALFDGPENLASRRNDELEEKARAAIAKAKGGAK